MGRLTASQHFGFAAVAFVAAMVQWKLIATTLGANYSHSADAALGVLQGIPHWRVYQGRLLGPEMIQLLQKVTDTFLSAHVLYGVITLSLAGYLAIVMVRRLTGNLGYALAALGLMHGLFAAVLAKPWLYAWDYGDLIIFLIFNYLVASTSRVRYLLALWTVAIFNRESAHFIALWIALDPLARYALSRLRGQTTQPFAWQQVALGLGMLSAGVAIIEMLRSHLLMKEIGPELWGPQGGVTGFIHFKLGANLDALSQLGANFNFGLNTLIPALIIGLVLFALLLAKRDPDRFLSLAVVHIGILIAIILFGLILESRVFIQLIPFVVINLWFLLPEAATEVELPGDRFYQTPNTHLIRAGASNIRPSSPSRTDLG